MSLNLPNDLINFLEKKKELEYDEDEVTPKELKLCKLADLKVEKIWVDGTTYDDNNILIQQAYYEVKAVNLIENCKNYSSYCLLMWLPEIKMYGAWDQDHWRITLFPNASWSDICNDPIPYINSQWEDDLCGVGEEYDPSDTYPLIIGWPF